MFFLDASLMWKLQCKSTTNRRVRRLHSDWVHHSTYLFALIYKNCAQFDTLDSQKASPILIGNFNKRGKFHIARDASEDTGREGRNY